MNYIECVFTLYPYRPFNEIVVAQLSEIGFESFTEEEKSSRLKAYIQEDAFTLAVMNEALSYFDAELNYELEVNNIEKENWNQKWEENFESVSVGNFCYVRAPFHEEKNNFQYEIIIEPKMSFGTGHHQTTQMMIELMEDVAFERKKVLDMGSGTGILAILAKKMQAERTIAIDIEDWAYENMKENFERNGVVAEAFLGGEELILELGLTYDVLIANINKNILLKQFANYDRHLNVGGELLLSGFYESDAEDLLSAPELSKYTKTKQLTKEGWCSLKLKKGE